MKSVSTSLPAAPAFSALLDIRGLQPSSVLCKLSENLGPSDQVNVYGTLDSAATSTSANITLLGSVYGNQGDTATPLTTGLWPYLFAKRVAGTATGTFFVSGSGALGLPIASGTTALPAINAFSAAINLASFGSGFPVRVGLDRSATSSDAFNVYGTNDPAFVGTSGGELINQIVGGSSNSSGIVLLQNYQYVYVQRVSGSTAGNLLAWGVDDMSVNIASTLNGNTVTYQQGGVANPQAGIYTSFAAAYAAATALSCPTISIDGSLGTPIVPASATVYSLSGMTLTTPNFAKLTWEDGANFSISDANLTIDGGLEMLTAATSAPTCTVTTASEGPVLILRGGSYLNNTSAATEPFFHVAAGGFFFVSFAESSSTDVVGTGTLFDVAVGGELAISMSGPFSVLIANSISGSGLIEVAWDSATSSVSPTQSATNVLWISGPSVTATFAAQATLPTQTAAQNIPPCGTTTTLASSDSLGTLSPCAGVAGTLFVRFTGSASNVGGQTAAVQIFRNGSAVTGLSVTGMATTAGAQSASTSITRPVYYAPGDVWTAQLTTGSLTAALTDLMVSVGSTP